MDDQSLPVIMVNESGASVYSASEIAREEFPDHDLTVRGVRLHRPPADGSIVRAGQDRSQVHRRGTIPARRGPVRPQRDPWTTWWSVASTASGVEVNRASVQLLTYVSGLGPQLAKNIVAFRDENGAFTRP